MLRCTAIGTDLPSSGSPIRNLQMQTLSLRLCKRSAIDPKPKHVNLRSVVSSVRVEFGLNISEELSRFLVWCLIEGGGNFYHERHYHTNEK